MPTQVGNYVRQKSTAKQLTYRWLTQEVSVVIDGEERQLLQIVRHQGGGTVEEGFQLLLLLVAGHLLALVALVEDGLHLWEPPEQRANGLNMSTSLPTGAGEKCYNNNNNNEL